jgi:hypothetical protein
MPIYTVLAKIEIEADELADATEAIDNALDGLKYDGEIDDYSVSSTVAALDDDEDNEALPSED